MDGDILSGRKKRGCRTRRFIGKLALCCEDQCPKQRTRSQSEGPFKVKMAGSSLVCAEDELSRIGTAAIGKSPISLKLGRTPSHCSGSTHVASEWPVIRD